MPARCQSLPAGDHLALNTDDMKMTLDFYLRVLGMRWSTRSRSRSLGTGPGNRAIRRSRTSPLLSRCGRRLAARFFEIRRAPSPRRPRRDRTMQHVSFAVSEQKFNDVLNRVKKSNIEYLGRSTWAARPTRSISSTRTAFAWNSRTRRRARPGRRALAPDQGRSARRTAHPDRRPGMAGNRGRALPERRQAGKSIISGAKWTSETTSNATTPA